MKQVLWLFVGGVVVLGFPYTPDAAECYLCLNKLELPIIIG